MKKLLLVAFAALIVSPAMAADLAVRVHKRQRPVVVASPVYSWTGFYVGGNIGYSWGNARTEIADSATLFPFAGIVPGFAGFPSNIAFADSNQARLSGVIGGGQIGFNYQFSQHCCWG